MEAVNKSAPAETINPMDLYCGKMDKTPCCSTHNECPPRYPNKWIRAEPSPKERYLAPPAGQYTLFSTSTFCIIIQTTMNIMEFIWETVDHTGDKDIAIYTETDLEGLWELGFVDTARFPKSEWFKVLNPYLQIDGSYKLTKADFLSLDKYRYQGEIKIPFNPLQINEGKYTDEGLQELLDLSIAPSVSLSSSDLDQKIESLKKKYRQADRLILIKMPAKQEIRQWVEQNPSPLRRLELLFADFLKQKGFTQEAMEKAQSVSRVATPDEQARVQASTFSVLPGSVVEEKAAGFKKMAKAKGPATHPDDDPTKPTLKKIKRSVKGTRS